MFDSSDHIPIKLSISETLNKMEGVLFCLVNNNCSELFGSQLDELAEEHDYVNVIHIKKRKPNLWAVRAGSRYLKNNFNLKFLAYIADLKGEELVNAIDHLLDRDVPAGTLDEPHYSIELFELVQEKVFK